MKYFKIDRTPKGFRIYELRFKFGFIPYWRDSGFYVWRFTETLGIIKDYCCRINKGKVTIFDKKGNNKKLVINYRRYPGEDLSELPQ